MSPHLFDPRGRDNPLIGVNKAVVLSPLCVSGRTAFVDWFVCVLEKQTEIEIGVLFFDQHKPLAISSFAEVPLALDNDLRRTVEVWRVAGIACRYREAHLQLLVIERNPSFVKLARNPTFQP